MEQPKILRQAKIYETKMKLKYDREKQLKIHPHRKETPTIDRLCDCLKLFFVEYQLFCSVADTLIDLIDLID